MQNVKDTKRRFKKWKKNLKLEKQKKEDIKLIFDFIKELAEYEKTSDDVIATEETLSYRLFDKKIGETLFIMVDGKEVGFASYFFNFSTFVGRVGLYLEDLYIRKEYRGRGYGTRVFKELAKIATQNDCKRFEWCCLNWNIPSIAFYKSLGVKPMDEWTTYRLSGDALKKLAE